VTSQASTYLTAAKVGALNAESLRFGGAATVPAARIGATHGEWPVSWADIGTQVTALQSVIGTAGNANG
jgi:hypothetical protein